MPMRKNYFPKDFTFSLRCLAFILLICSAQSTYSQGLACNSGVNISLDQNCTAVINARHILKGEAPDADPLLYEVYIKNADGSLPDSLDVEFSNTAISSTV